MDTIAAISERPLRPPLRIVLPGGSGLVGQVLARHFQEQGHHVTVLTRGPYTAPWQTVHRHLHQPYRTQRELPFYDSQPAGYLSIAH